MQLREGFGCHSPVLISIKHSKGKVGNLPVGFRLCESAGDHAEYQQEGSKQAHEQRLCFCFIAGVVAPTGLQPKRRMKKINVAHKSPGD